MKVSFGPTTSTPARVSSGSAYSSHAARCRPTAVLPVPGPPWITSAPSLVTADQLVLVGRDRRDDLAHLAHALARDVLDDRLGQVVVVLGRERLVDEAEHRAVLDVEPAAAPDALRVVRRRRVERHRRRRAPVDRQQVVVRAPDGVAPDVERLLAVDAAEVQRPARLRVLADALAPHLLERLVGVVVAAARRPPPGQRRERDVEGRAGLVQVPLFVLERSHSPRGYAARRVRRGPGGGPREDALADLEGEPARRRRMVEPAAA